MDDIGPLTNTKNRLKKRTLIDLMAKAESFSFFPPLEDVTEENRQEQQGQSVSESREGGE